MVHAAGLDFDGLLAGKVALITGAASGQGRAAGLLFGAQGARVVVADVNDDGAAETVKMLEEQGSEGLAVHADVSVRDDVDAMVAATVERYGRLDVLYNNAAVQMSGRLVECTEDDWDLTIATNLVGDLLGVPCGAPPSPRGRRRQHHQHRVDARAHRLRGLRRLRRREGRARPAHEAARRRVRPRGPGERDRAGFDRHPAVPQGRSTRRPARRSSSRAWRRRSPCRGSARRRTSRRSPCSSPAT